MKITVEAGPEQVRLEVGKLIRRITGTQEREQWADPKWC